MEMKRIRAIAAYASTQGDVWSNHLIGWTGELLEDLEVREDALARLRADPEMLEGIQQVRATTKDDPAGQALAALLSQMLIGLQSHETDDIVTLLEAEWVHRIKWDEVMLRNPLTLEYLREAACGETHPLLF
jgi:hypothetical protein